jgi:hypothetical protein
MAAIHMKHPGIWWRIGIVVVIGIVFIVPAFFWRKYSNIGQAPATDRPIPTSELIQEAPIPEPVSENEIVAGPSSKDAFVSPVARADERVTKKPFGMYITRVTSPVQPERFSGYHTGVDFEIFPEEQESDVAISAICSGPLVSERSASGYGGVLVQTCVMDGEPITVVYGHMRLSSVAATVGATVEVGAFLGNLGTAFSAQTDGERKHLHLGIHRGTTVSMLGYVQSKAHLSDWIDPCTLICHS